MAAGVPARGCRPAGPGHPTWRTETSRITTGRQDVTGNALERLSDATRMLAEISTASDAWDLARTAEAARRYAQMKGMGHEAINHATAIKAKAIVLIAEIVDKGQQEGTIASRDQPVANVRGPYIDRPMTLPELLPDSKRPRAEVAEARRLRDSLAGQDIDTLVAEANAAGEDFGILGLRHAAAANREPAPVPEPVPLPSGTFPCLVMDPPWPMPKIDRHNRVDQGAHLDYPVMTLDEIAKLPVAEKAADDAHLYLWVTHKFLPAGLDLAEQWGFRYQCLMTWRKNVGITPYSWMYDTEHVIFARRGNLPLTQLGLRLSFDAPVAGHSVKPDVFYERVLAASPGPRLEMFARRERDGFTPWGNEVTNAAV